MRLQRQVWYNGETKGFFFWFEYLFSHWYILKGDLNSTISRQYLKYYGLICQRVTQIHSTLQKLDQIHHMYS